MNTRNLKFKTWFSMIVAGALALQPAFLSAEELSRPGRDAGSIELPGQSQGPGQAGGPEGQAVISSGAVPTPTPVGATDTDVLDPNASQEQGSGGTGKTGCNAKTCEVTTTSTGSISNPPTEGCVDPPCTPDECDEGCEQQGNIITRKGSVSRIIDHVGGTYTVTITCISIRVCLKPEGMTASMSQDGLGNSDKHG